MYCIFYTKNNVLCVNEFTTEVAEVHKLNTQREVQVLYIYFV